MKSHISARGARESGSTLLVALITMAVLTTIAASVFLSSVPAYRGTYQASAWQEAKLAADAGVDYAMATLQKTAPNPMLYKWDGWTLQDGVTAVPENYDGIRVYVPPAGSLGKGDGTSKPRVSKIEIDVITRDTNFAQNAWFRIRSTGLAEVNSSQLSLDKRDLSLRRMTLKQQHITRTVEVLSRPVYLWEYCLKTSGSMVLGGGSTWRIDSYDSRFPLGGIGPDGKPVTDPRSTRDRMYDVQYSRPFGNIASDMERPENSPIGVLIDAEGALVKGEVQTHGGDDPYTEAHENVEEADQIDSTRITDEYDETLDAEKTPDWVATCTNIKTGTQASIDPLTQGTNINDPYRIVINPQGNKAIGGFTVVNPTIVKDEMNGEVKSFGHKYVDIYINGNVNLGGSTIIVQKGVHVNLYLNGDLDFKNQDINYANPAVKPELAKTTSNQPADLLIYGVKKDGSPRVDSSGNGHICAAFYGPQYAGNLDGNTEIVGSFVLKTYNIAGGGGAGGDSLGAGLHYDEALGVVGPVKYYKAVSYFEDTRKDLE